MKVTGSTVTPEQIQELINETSKLPGSGAADIKAICELALATFEQRAGQKTQDSKVDFGLRAVCAEIINARTPVKQTLVEQLENVACRRVNESWWRAIHAPGAANGLAVLAFGQNWDRNSFDARVVLAYLTLLERDGAVPVTTPGVPGHA